MADLLAAHQQDADNCDCGQGYSWRSLDTFVQQHAKHLEAILTAAGYGNTRALLADLRALGYGRSGIGTVTTDTWLLWMKDDYTNATNGESDADVALLARAARALLARHAPEEQ